MSRTSGSIRIVLPVPRRWPSKRSRSLAPSDALAAMIARPRSSAAVSPASRYASRADSNSLRPVLAELLERRGDELVEVGLAAVEVVEPARDLARDLDVRRLVDADGHVRRLVDQDVGGLQERIAEEAVGREVAVLEALHLVLVGRHALEPAERRSHRQQREQLGVLGQAALDEERDLVRVEAGGEPVGDHVVDRALDHLALFVVRRQRMPVGGEEEALVPILQAHPVLERAVPVAEVHRAGRPHAREDTAARGHCLAFADGRRRVARRGGLIAHGRDGQSG